MKIRKVKSLVYNEKGEKIILYPIGDLAAGLGRKTQTIRKWIKLGVLPEAQFRDGANGRFYTQEQIDLIVRLAKECDIMQGQAFRITGFKEKVLEGWKSLVEVEQK